VLLFDAAGLAFFAVSGAQRRSTMAGPRGDIAWDVRRIGGGMIQHVLLTEIPTVCFASATGADLVQELRQGCQDRCRPQPENRRGMPLHAEGDSKQTFRTAQLNIVDLGFYKHGQSC
jgi:hypothetical protein